VTVDEVSIDNTELSPTGTSRLSLDRGSSFALKVKLTAVADAKDVEIRAFIAGFDSSTQDITDTTPVFDVSNGVSYVKTLNLKLPDKAQVDSYKIRVIVADRNDADVSQDYNIAVTATTHDVIIRELSVSPDSLQAGRAILATVRVKNLGAGTENDVRIKVSIPELGISATPDYINEIKSDDSATSQEFFLRVDSCVKPGTYTVKADVTFQDGDKTVSATAPITVTSGACASAPVTTGTVQIAYTAEPQNVNAGGQAVAYVMTITNNGDAAKTYTLSIDTPSWGTVKISPSNLVVVNSGGSQATYIYVSANKNAPQGGQSLIVRIKDMSGNVVKELPISANVVGGAAGTSTGVIQALQIGLIAVIIVLVIVAIVVAFRKMKGPREGEEGTQTYY